VLLVGFNTIFLILACVMIGLGVYLKVAAGAAIAGSGSGIVAGSGSLGSVCSIDAIQDGTFQFNVCIREICSTLDSSGDLCAKLESLPLGVIVLGAFIMLLSFLACAGACCKNKAILVIYFIVMFLIFLAQIAVVIMFFFARDWLNAGITTSFQELGQTETGSQQLVGLMKIFQCCGYPTTSDITLTLPSGVGSGTVEYTNCASIPAAILPAATTANGCEDTLITAVQGNLPVAGGVGAGLVVMQLFALILTCCVIKNIKTEDDGGDYVGARGGGNRNNFQSI